MNFYNTRSRAIERFQPGDQRRRGIALSGRNQEASLVRGLVMTVGTIQKVEWARENRALCADAPGATVRDQDAGKGVGRRGRARRGRAGEVLLWEHRKPGRTEG
jgi:hypothetical protein